MNDHFVQFYRTDDFLIDCVARYAVDGIWKGDVVIVIATAAHRLALEERLRVKGVNLISAIVEQRLLLLDAEELLAQITVGGRIDDQQFQGVVGTLVARACDTKRHVRGFGEMVAILWQRGDPEAAIELERLWNGLAERYPFRLFCAYPSGCFDGKDGGVGFEHVCKAHTYVLSLGA